MEPTQEQPILDPVMSKETGLINDFKVKDSFGSSECSEI